MSYANNTGLGTVSEVLSSTDKHTNEYITSPASVTSPECVDLHDSCAEFDLVYGFCHAPPRVSPLLYKQAHEECRRTCNFC